MKDTKQTQSQPRLWRSLEELAETEGFEEMLHREFPRQAAAWDDAVSRRQFLKVSAAVLALAGLSGCFGRQPRETIVPYVQQPEQLVPGRPLFYATAVTLGGYAMGVLAESHEGRPTKLEGNPSHPASLGATDAITQATILDLYDPDRSQTILDRGQISTWDNFLRDLRAVLVEQQASQGAGLRILSGAFTSPTLASQMQALLQQFPQARWHQYEPAGHENALAGSQLAFGQPVATQIDLSRAGVILALEDDFLMHGPASVRLERQFVNRRRVRADQTDMNRLYVVESTYTTTGAMADHRVQLRSSQIEGFVRSLAAALGVEVNPAGGSAPAEAPFQPAFLDALARDLQAHRGASAVLVGQGQPPVVHALVHAINAALGNVGTTVTYTAPVAVDAGSQGGSLADLAQDMAAGAVQALVVLDANPVYDAPADLQFADRLNQVPLRIHLGLYADETARLSHWHIPETHSLETWSDARAFDGTVTIMQPLLAPLYGGRSAHELVAALLGDTGTSSHDLVKEYWQGQRGEQGAAFDAWWQRSLHDGVVAGSALPAVTVGLRPAAEWSQAPARSGDRPEQGTEPQPDSGLEVIFRPDPTVWDGRFANNGWLQELPKPLTKLTWDNAALLSPATAARLGVANFDVVELSYGGRKITAPVVLMPGHVDDAVTLTLGYGRTQAGRVGTDAGYNAYALRTSDAPWFGQGLELRRTGRQQALAVTQGHFNLEGRDLVRVATIDEFRRNPEFAQEGEQAPQGSIYPEYDYSQGHAWGMSIDLNACVGCNACVVACNVENNIPVVGKEMVQRQREMHWLRIDTYFEGEPQQPSTYFEPILCMHCEKAPCEVVCPVEATVHSSEGLNDMVYNRCVGTRYCSNNCPYKVRRFNFLQFADYDTERLKPMRNPDVTVRSRGVMEKCTYCVQRIVEGRIEAEKQGRPVRDGEILTACQQACPTRAIVFGDINDKGAQVTQLKAQPHNYGLLTDLNTQPRTSYLARLRNPNPEIEAS